MALCFSKRSSWMYKQAIVIITLQHTLFVSFDLINQKPFITAESGSRAAVVRMSVFRKKDAKEHRW